MTTIRWSDDFLVGMSDLDQDHRELVERITLVRNAVEDKAAPHRLLAMVDALLELIIRHMAREDAHLRRLSEPGGVEHRRRHMVEHARLISRVNSARELVAAGYAETDEWDDIAVLLTVTELIRTDFEMIGHLRREGLLHADSGTAAAGRPVN